MNSKYYLQVCCHLSIFTKVSNQTLCRRHPDKVLVHIFILIQPYLCTPYLHVELIVDAFLQYLLKAEVFCIYDDDCFLLYSYSSWPAYGQSKLSNILHANELTKRLKVCWLCLCSVVIHTILFLFLSNYVREISFIIIIIAD